jgi:hypothetical protein
MRVRRLAGRTAASLGVAVLGLGLLSVAGGADAPATPPVAFQGSSAAAGVLLNVTIPGAPLTDTPLDSGGPTAQVAVDTIGDSTGYAAFPDPGPLPLTAIGLIPGLFGLGLAGLPPIKVPSLPAYPFDVTSDASSNPTASLGAGPYHLSADSSATSSSATATAGLQTDAVGNAALATSTASLTVGADGSVVATATTDVQGLSVGPLTFGEVSTTATETLASDGTLTPSTALRISGAQIAGLPVDVGSATLSVAGETVPLPINATFSKLLSASGMSVSVVTAQQFPGRVISPGILITAPVNVAIGRAPGTFTTTIGSATAAMTVGAPAAPATGGTVSSGGGSTLPPAGVSSPTLGVGTVPPLTSSNVTSSAGPSPIATTALGAAAGPPSSSAAGSSGGAATPIRVAPAALVGLFDIQSLYLVVAACGVAAWGLVQLIRLLGVRKPWSSGNG